MRQFTRLNSTGSLKRDNFNGTIYSYSTPIFREFALEDSDGNIKKLIDVFNDTYYSATTRKHQSNIDYKKASADLILHYCPYGEWTLETGLKNEITMAEYELEKLQNKTRKLGKRQAEKLETLTKILQELKELYAEV